MEIVVVKHYEASYPTFVFTNSSKVSVGRERKIQTGPKKLVNVRLTEEEIVAMKIAAKASGSKSVSAFIRGLVSASSMDAFPGPAITHQASGHTDLVLQTSLGQIIHGDSLIVMRGSMADKSVDLIVTSPPFGLITEKSYGNEPAHRYLEWFRPFAEEFKRVLKDSGSLVIDIGGAWNEGKPTRSLYQFKLLIMLCEEFGFHLAQDFYWWNPARLPSPAEWVNIRRIRVKDAVNCVWWLSPTPWPKASNRRILAEYSTSMAELLTSGKYNAGPRPSGHNISTVFSRDNGGAIPPNLIAAPNTRSDDIYQQYCRANALTPHPARFPKALPELFIRMLTDKGDLVYDPFGGSCQTGEVCQNLERRWICSEIHRPFLDGAVGRFGEPLKEKEKKKRDNHGYSVPGLSPYDEQLDETKLDVFGGKTKKKLPNTQLSTTSSVETSTTPQVALSGE